MGCDYEKRIIGKECLLDAQHAIDALEELGIPYDIELYGRWEDPNDPPPETDVFFDHGRKVEFIESAFSIRVDVDGERCTLKPTKQSEVRLLY